MSATNVFENGLLSLIFENANYANVGDATGLRGSTTAGVFYVSLHTASPADTGDQTTNETAYTNYLRSGGSVARSTAGWSVASGVADNDAAITYAACGASGATLTHFGIGSDSTAAGNLFLWGALTASLVVSSGITPSFAAGALDVTLD
jgi:hypothetical protein